MLPEEERRQAVIQEAAKSPEWLPELDRLNGSTQRMGQWLDIVVRDAAVSMRQFLFLVGAIKNLSSDEMNYLSNVDKTEIDRVLDEFKRQFPDVKVVRDGVVHYAERSSSWKQWRDHSVSGRLQYIRNGRRVAITYNKRLAQIDVTEETRDALRGYYNRLANAIGFK